MLNSRISGGMARLLAAAAMSGLGSFGIASPTSDVVRRGIAYEPHGQVRNPYLGAGKGRDRDANGMLKGRPGSKLARKAAKGSLGLYGGRRGLTGSDVR